jgi:hypothetical protein
MTVTNSVVSRQFVPNAISFTWKWESWCLSDMIVRIRWENVHKALTVVSSTCKSLRTGTYFCFSLLSPITVHFLESVSPSVPRFFKHIEVLNLTEISASQSRCCGNLGASLGQHCPTPRFPRISFAKLN